MTAKGKGKTGISVLSEKRQVMLRPDPGGAIGTVNEQKRRASELTPRRLVQDFQTHRCPSCFAATASGLGCNSTGAQTHKRKFMDPRRPCRLRFGESLRSALAHSRQQTVDLR